jgi:two-component system, NtrC family, sensor kinase
VTKIKSTKYTSLRFILIAWFVAFSILPLGVVSWYSLLKFQKAIESEQLQRLKSNGREIEVIISDYYNQLRSNRQLLEESPQFTYNLSVADLGALKEISSEWLHNSIISSIAIYGQDGTRLSLATKDEAGVLKINQALSDKTTLSEKYTAHLADKSDLGVINQDNPEGTELLLFSKIINSNGKNIGYIEQKIILQQQFLVRVKNKIKLDLMLTNSQKQPIFSTINIEKSNFPIINSKFSSADPDTMIDIKNNNNLYGFILYPIIWDRSAFSVAIGTSKNESQMVLANVNVAFIGVISLVVLFLIVTILISTSVLLRPINELIEGLLAFEKTDSLVQLAVKNKTEIGLLTATFNQMSLKIFQTRKDLKNKIKELEKANSNLKEAQTKLVHSAKMTSLGQLVAGVAHELNNPISFIYSNTSHLKDYSEKLFKIIDEIEKNPPASERIKLENEFDYIQKDLPRLIKSCQDEAQRTRDIIIGLRNFSRLEESQLKEIDLIESIDTTLELLKGEVTNRIQIHRNYENIPLVLCYASQINQVIMNILTNAVYAVSGNGQIWISTTALKAGAQGAGKVQISIQDSGVGMSPEVIDKIFEPFFTTKDVGRGTGLGLSISYGIIQNHGGDIEVRSQKGVGTEFIVTIPVSQPKPKAPNSP